MAWNDLKPEQVVLAKAKIVDGLKLGVSYTTAAKAAGVARSSYYNWRKVDPAFDAACEEAEAVAIQEYADQLKKSAVQRQLLFSVNDNYNFRSVAPLT